MCDFGSICRAIWKLHEEGFSFLQPQFIEFFVAFGSHMATMLAGERGVLCTDVLSLNQTLKLDPLR